MNTDDTNIPSPFEVMQHQTQNGGWTRHDLESWGVAWPPPSGWKDQLENAYKSGKTLGFILECIGCRKGKYFVDFEEYPICNDCQKYEQEKYEKEHQDSRNIIQRIAPIFNKNKKEPIPNELRWAVWERDNFTCQHCGSRRGLSVDHVVPESKGGKATMDNCQTLCKSCNSRKGAK